MCNLKTLVSNLFRDKTAASHDLLPHIWWISALRSFCYSNSAITLRCFEQHIFRSFPENSSSLRREWMEWNIQNETRFTLTECFQNFSSNRTSRDTIHKTFGGLLTLYLNNHFVALTLTPTVDNLYVVFSTLRSLQCKDCNFCLSSIDVFLNATLVNTFWNRCVDVYVMFVHNDEGFRAEELKEDIAKRSIKVVLPHQGNVITFQNRERIWRSCRNCWC